MIYGEEAFLPDAFDEGYGHLTWSIHDEVVQLESLSRSQKSFAVSRDYFVVN